MEFEDFTLEKKTEIGKLQLHNLENKKKPLFLHNHSTKYNL